MSIVPPPLASCSAGATTECMANEAAQAITAPIALLRSAQRALASAGDVGSPCISVCRMSAGGLCEGCLRSLPEIAGWSRMDDMARRVVWASILGRAREAVAALP